MSAKRKSKMSLKQPKTKTNTVPKTQTQTLVVQGNKSSKTLTHLFLLLSVALGVVLLVKFVFLPEKPNKDPKNTDTDTPTTGTPTTGTPTTGTPTTGTPEGSNGPGSTNTGPAGWKVGAIVTWSIVGLIVMGVIVFVFKKQIKSFFTDISLAFASLFVEFNEYDDLLLETEEEVSIHEKRLKDFVEHLNSQKEEKQWSKKFVDLMNEIHKDDESYEYFLKNFENEAEKFENEAEKFGKNALEEAEKAGRGIRKLKID